MNSAEREAQWIKARAHAEIARHQAMLAQWYITARRLLTHGPGE